MTETEEQVLWGLGFKALIGITWIVFTVPPIVTYSWNWWMEVFT